MCFMNENIIDLIYIMVLSNLQYLFYYKYLIESC